MQLQVQVLTRLQKMKYLIPDVYFAWGQHFLCNRVLDTFAKKQVCRDFKEHVVDTHEVRYVVGGKRYFMLGIYLEF
jgi:cupin superfamily acireductone dioxygenase involved in methionine salvage